MNSTFSGIEMGKRSLIAHTQGMSTIGHNLSNASVEGYSRQRVEMRAFDPLYMPALNRENVPGQIGQGVEVERIERVRDMLLEGRIVSRANGQGYWEARDRYMLMVEQVYNEPTDVSVRGLMDRFWESWQELSLYPSEMPARRNVIEKGQVLIDGINSRYASLKQIRDMIEDDVKVTVGQVNGILKDISGLNEQIVKVKAMGDNPNDLLDRRDLLVKRLSNLIDITVDERDPDEFMVHTGGLHLIQGRVINYLRAESDPLNDSYSTVRWDASGDEAFFRGGKLASLIEMRDLDVREEIQKLDMMTINFIDLVNENHRAGYGKNGRTGVDFFQEYPFVNNIAGNYDRNGDGAFDSTYVFRISGTNTLSAQEQVGLQGTIRLSGPVQDIEVGYFPTDTVEDIVKRINNSGAEVVARLDRDGYLSLKATPAFETENPDFVIRHVEDSGQFLSGYAGLLLQSGPAGAYDWGGEDAVLALRGGVQFAVAPLAHPSGWIRVNREVANDPGTVAAGFGVNGRPAEAGDGTAAIAIAGLRNNPVMIGRLMTFDDYFADVVAAVGLKGEEAALSLETENLIMKELGDLREALSGVNIDEELSQMIKYQHGYSAASRFVTEIDKMLDTIINRMGV